MRWLAFAALAAAAPQDLRTVEDLGLRVAPGFTVSLYSGPDLANDLYAMTLDPRGRPVVSSQGWIRILHDDDGDGRADRASEFAATRTGAMGLCFDGPDLYVSADGGLWRHRDADGDGRADAPPERLLKLDFGEHGAHAMRKGPDGFWYVIGGNDAGIGPAHVTAADSPVREPEAGAILRASPDWKRVEVLAHGFRNPYDFDFDGHGEIFTYDSDCERDYFLPWYTPTRLYQVAPGLHHGWRLKGWQRSFARADYFADTPDILWPVGRGSPTGVTVYRHTAFPERYREGVFYADWTFGKVYFTPLIPQGAGYAPRAEVFLEPAGSEGFAPTDLCVAPDGALLVSIGGRRTRGAIYRIQADTPAPASAPTSDLEAVLRAPQPLDAWSRARWEPLARKIGKGPFEEFLRQSRGTPAEQRRAVEVLTEIFDGASPTSPVRARAAWSLGRKGTATETLLAMAAERPVREKGDEAAVRRNALEALAARAAELKGDWIASVVTANLGHADKRVRLAAAHLAARLPEEGWKHLADSLGRASLQARVTAAMARAWRGAPAPEELADLLPSLPTDALRLDAVRILILSLGDARIHTPEVEVHSNYALSAPPAADLRAKILAAVRPLFPSGDPRLDLEATRLLAMLEDEEAATPAKVAAAIDDPSPATRDVHFLIVLSRLGGPWPDGLGAKAAGALLSLGRKLEGQEQRTKQVWGARLAELVPLFARRDPAFAGALLDHPLFAAPGHVEIAAALPAAERLRAAALFRDAVARDASFGWSERLIDLLSGLPAEQFHAVLRPQWSNFALRDAIALRLAARPDPQDREKFLAGIESAHLPAARASLEALEKLPRDETPANLVPLLRLLRRLLLEPRQAALRKQVAGLVARQTGVAREIREGGTEPADLRRAYQPLFDAFLAKHADLRAELEGTEDPAALRELLKTVPWDRGDAARGAEVFRARGCQTCHAVQGALGPNLAGAARRFSREDLFEAIANPGKDVAPLYRTTAFRMKDGQVHTGIVVFESADGYILQTGATTTVRVNTPDIAQSRPGASSLMPNDLLKGLKAEDLADLYAYLRGLNP